MKTMIWTITGLTAGLAFQRIRLIQIIQVIQIIQISIGH